MVEGDISSHNEYKTFGTSPRMTGRIIGQTQSLDDIDFLCHLLLAPLRTVSFQSCDSSAYKNLILLFPLEKLWSDKESDKY